MIRQALAPVAHFIFSIFFEKKYLRGRLFESEYGGYLHCARALWQRNILRLGPTFPFPVGLTCTLSSAKNITFHIDDLNNFNSPGVYFQNFKGHIYLGQGTYIAPNVGIITTNHDLLDLRYHSEISDVIIGDKCWLGMNSVILPGVVLGESTIVAAGAVVTKSFPQGKVVLAGIPAKIIKVL